jgi:Flp pilus assembly pilin Flp
MGNWIWLMLALISVCVLIGAVPLSIRLFREGKGFGDGIQNAGYCFILFAVIAGLTAVFIAAYIDSFN